MCRFEGNWHFSALLYFLLWCEAEEAHCSGSRSLELRGVYYLGGLLFIKKTNLPKENVSIFKFPVAFGTWSIFPPYNDKSSHRSSQKHGNRFLSKKAPPGGFMVGGHKCIFCVFFCAFFSWQVFAFCSDFFWIQKNSDIEPRFLLIFCHFWFFFVAKMQRVPKF